MCVIYNQHIRIVYDVLTGRSQDGEEESGTKYTVSGLVYQIYKKRILQWSKVCAARPRIGDKSLKKSLLCFAKFLTCEKIFYYEQSASICVNQS